VINGCTCNGTNTAAVDEVLTINNTNNFTIEHCLVENPVADPRCGIGIGVGCTNGVISYNTVANCSGLGIYVSCMGVSMSNIAIYDNAVYNCAEGGIGLADEDAATDSGITLTNVNIYNNLIYGNNRGFRVDQFGNGTTTGSMFNFSFINNTLYNNGTASEIFLDNTPQYFSNCIIRNNILMNTLSASDSAIAYADYAGGGVTVDHNLEYNSLGTGGSNITGTSCITTNPELINPTSNFALQSTSPAINSGSAAGAPSTDYIGTARPQASGYDIGAFEYVVSTIFPALTPTAASNVTSNEAILNGSLTTLGSTSPVTVSFEWGIDTSYSGGDIVANPSSITSVPTAFSASLSGLTANTTYHFRAEAVGATTVYGGDQQFTTSPVDLVVTSSSLPNAIVGEAYSQSLSASGGSTPYTWKIVSGVLPNGLSFSSSGIISGTPTAASGPTAITFQVTDTTNSNAENAIPISVGYSPYDINMDGTINVLDLVLINQDLGETGAPGWIREDVKDNGVISVLDTILVAEHFN
jgi:hypothetical protein